MAKPKTKAELIEAATTNYQIAFTFSPIVTD